MLRNFKSIFMYDELITEIGKRKCNCRGCNKLIHKGQKRVALLGRFKIKHYKEHGDTKDGHTTITKRFLCLKCGKVEIREKIKELTKAKKNITPKDMRIEREQYKEDKIIEAI